MIIILIIMLLMRLVMFMMIKGYGDHFFGDILLLLMIENYDAGLYAWQR